MARNGREPDRARPDLAAAEEQLALSTIAPFQGDDLALTASGERQLLLGVGVCPQNLKESMHYHADRRPMCAPNISPCLQDDAAAGDSPVSIAALVALPMRSAAACRSRSPT